LEKKVSVKGECNLEFRYFTFPSSLKAELVSEPRKMKPLYDKKQEVELKMHTALLNRSAKIGKMNRWNDFKEKLKRSHPQKNNELQFDLVMVDLYQKYNRLVCKESEIKFMGAQDLEKVCKDFQDFHMELIGITDNDVLSNQ
jgi:hypothetical protein